MPIKKDIIIKLAQVKNRSTCSTRSSRSRRILDKPFHYAQLSFDGWINRNRSDILVGVGRILEGGYFCFQPQLITCLESPTDHLSRVEISTRDGSGKDAIISQSVEASPLIIHEKCLFRAKHNAIEHRNGGNRR